MFQLYKIYQLTTMRKLCILFFVAFAITGRAQNVPIIKWDAVEKIIQSSKEEILVFNFWATWCAPCVKELPYFESLNEKASPETRVILINLDFADKVERVKSFVNRKSMKSEIFLLDEIDYNSWIDKVDPSWQGAIPATLIINSRTGHRKFLAKELEEGQLEKLIDEISKG
jgi:thiol-disulfide isomerase/thioredoxin